MKKLTIEELRQLIRAEYYTRVPDSTTTICSIELKSGYQIVGTSACLNPADFDDELGRNLAYKKAEDQLWELEGYARLREAEKANKPTTAKERVEAELARVEQDLKALIAMLDKGQPSFVDDIGWELLHEQRKHMQGYVDVLTTRLENWGNP